jgi:hypothetical protein
MISHIFFENTFPLKSQATVASVNFLPVPHDFFTISWVLLHSHSLYWYSHDLYCFSHCLYCICTLTAPTGTFMASSTLSRPILAFSVRYDAKVASSLSKLKALKQHNRFIASKLRVQKQHNRFIATLCTGKYKSLLSGKWASVASQETPFTPPFLLHPCIH